MRVRVTTAYGDFRVDDIIPDMPGNVARTMIGRGYVAEIADTDADRQMRPARSGVSGYLTRSKTPRA